MFYRHWQTLTEVISEIRNDFRSLVNFATLLLISILNKSKIAEGLFNHTFAIPQSVIPLSISLPSNSFVHRYLLFAS